MRYRELERDLVGASTDGKFDMVSGRRSWIWNDGGKTVSESDIQGAADSFTCLMLTAKLVRI